MTLTREQVEGVGLKSRKVECSSTLWSDIDSLVDTDAALRQQLEQVASGHHRACAAHGYTDTEGVPHPPVCHPDCFLQRAEIAEAQLDQRRTELAEVREERDEVTRESIKSNKAYDRGYQQGLDDAHRCEQRHAHIDQLERQLADLQWKLKELEAELKPFRDKTERGYI